MKVYNRKQAIKINGKWDKSLSRIERSGLKLDKEQADALNFHFKVTGQYYEVDEKATKEYNSLTKKAKK